MMVRRLGVAIFLLVVLAYSLAISTNMINRNQGESFVMINSMLMLLTEGGIGLPPWHESAVVGRGGKSYPYHEFGQALIALPLFAVTWYRVNDSFALYFVNILATAAVCVVLLRFLVSLGFGARSSALACLAYAFGSIAFFYSSKVPFPHPLESLFVMLALYYGFLYGRAGKYPYLVYCVLFIGLGFIVKSQPILLLAPVGYLVYAKLRRDGSALSSKQIALLILTLSPFMAWYIAYNLMRFESPFETGYALLLGDKFTFSISNIPFGLAGFLVSPGRSIFVYGPVFVLSLMGARKFYKRLPLDESVYLAGAVAVYLLFVSSYPGWDGGACYGPRHLLAIMPVLSMPMVVLFEGWPSMGGIKKGIVAAVIAFSVLAQLPPVISNFTLGLSNRAGITRVDDWSGLKVHMNPENSPFLAQAEASIDNIRLFFNPSYAKNLASKLISEHKAEKLLLSKYYAEPDLWWIQHGAVGSRALATALGLALVAVTAYLAKLLLQADRCA